MFPGKAPDRVAEKRASRLVLSVGLLWGIVWFAYYYALGLTTAHYDAKARLLIARRLVDSLEPGYLQMGTHWLPLIHLLYLPFVVFDSQYQTGFLPSLLSVTAYGLSGWLLYRIALRVTGLWQAGVFAAVVFFANSNWQYLQSCPLTEPVFTVFMLLGLDRLLAWRESQTSTYPWSAALWTALSCLCRYEGWLFFAGVLAYLGFELWRGGLDRKSAARGVTAFALVFALPIAAHFGYLFAWTGESFFHRVARGYPAPYVTHRRPFLSLFYHTGELAQMASSVPMVMAIGGIVYCMRRWQRLVRCSPLFLLWLPSLMNVAALYWGLIYRVRYSALLVPAFALFAALTVLSASALKRTMTAGVLVVALLPWATRLFPRSWELREFLAGPGVVLLPLVALGLFLYAHARGTCLWASMLLCAAGAQIPVLEGEYRPILAETLEHNYLEPERQEVLQHLKGNYDGTRILIDIARLAPLIYDTGIEIREFVYNEGQQKEWVKALRNPAQEVGWICMEKDDELWNLTRVDPHWADMYSLAVQTRNYRVYRLHSNMPGNPAPARRFE